MVKRNPRKQKPANKKNVNPIPMLLAIAGYMTPIMKANTKYIVCVKGATTFLASSENNSPRRMKGTGPKPIEKPIQTKQSDGTGSQLKLSISFIVKKAPTPISPTIMHTNEADRRNTRPKRSMKKAVERVVKTCATPSKIVANDGSIDTPALIKIVVE